MVRSNTTELGAENLHIGAHKKNIMWKKLALFGSILGHCGVIDDSWAKPLSHIISLGMSTDSIGGRMNHPISSCSNMVIS